MKHLVKTEFTESVAMILSKLPTPPVPNGFLGNMRDFGYYGVTSAQDMCDFLEISALDFSLILLRYPEATATFRKARVKLKMDATASILTIANSDLTEKSINSVLKAWEFISNNVTKTTLAAERLTVDKEDTKEKTRISRAILKQNKQRLKHAMDYDFARFTAANDEETIRRTLNVLNQSQTGLSE